MPISNAFDLNVLRPLRYATRIGQLDVATPSVFPVQGSGSSNFIVGEQAVDLQVSGLKPGTFHKAFLNGVDVTQNCKQIGRRLGEGLITSVQDFKTQIRNRFSGADIFFTFYITPEIIANTPVEQSAAEADLLGSQRVLVIRSDDGLSVASISFNLPNFARNEPQIEIKKTPVQGQVASDIQIVTNDKPSVQRQYIDPVQYTLVQTFFADKEIVQNAGEVFLTSVDLYFKNKPNVNTSVSGNPQPGVSISICEVENNSPVIAKTIAESLTRKSYDEIFSYSDASTPVTFGFAQPVRLSTDRFYGIVVIFEDPSFELWQNVVGDKLVGTNIASSGVNSNKDGKLFSRNNSGVFYPISDADLKFGIKCARFIEQQGTKKYITFDYEFFTLTNRVGNFIGGESVFKIRPPEIGTISIFQGSNQVVGSGTAFTQLSEDEVFVISTGAGSGDNHVALVENVANDTFMTLSAPLPFSNNSASYIRTVVGKVYYKDIVNNRMFLNNSTANTFLFAAGDQIQGTLSAAKANILSVEDISVDRVRLQGDVSVPSLGNIQFELTGSNKTGNTVSFTPGNNVKLVPNALTTTSVINFNQFIQSRSNELQNNNLLIDEANRINRKSLVLDVTMEAESNPFVSPSIFKSDLNLIVGENFISNTVDAIVNNILIDTEVNNLGTARSRHVSNQVTFDTDRVAEDLRLFMTAYRPLGTELRVYAKLYNSNDSDAYDDKDWTPLTYVGSNSNKFSSSQDPTNFIEYELAIPRIPAASVTSNVTFTASGNVLTSSDPARLNPSTFVKAGEIIRVYDPIFSDDNYTVVPVQSANSTAIVTSFSTQTGNVLVDKLKYPNANFLNPGNDFVTRYFNSQASAYDGFDTMQIKIVFISNRSNLVPRVDQIQVIGVSV